MILARFRCYRRGLTLTDRQSKFHAASVVKELPFLQGTHITPLVPAEFRIIQKFFVFLSFLSERTPPQAAVDMAKTRTNNYAILSSEFRKNLRMFTEICRIFVRSCYACAYYLLMNRDLQDGKDFQDKYTGTASVGQTLLSVPRGCVLVGQTLLSVQRGNRQECLFYYWSVHW